MEEGPVSAARPGYLVVLIGAVGFVVSCFLPYERGPVPSGPSSSVSLYRVLTFIRPSLLERVGELLFLFAGIAVIAGIAVAGIRSEPPWAPRALAAATAVWSLSWIGLLLGQSALIAPLQVGFWALLISTGVVTFGAIVVWKSTRTTRRPRLRDRPDPGG